MKEPVTVRENSVNPRNAVGKAVGWGDRIRSIADRVDQISRIERQHRGNPRLAAARQAFNNAVERRLLEQGQAGRFMADVMRAESVFDNSFSGSNAAQRLFNMSRAGNKTAKRLLNSRRR